MKNTSKLSLIKWIHTIVWLVFALAVLYIIYSALFDDVGMLTWLSIAAILAETLVLLAFKWRCPLTLVAQDYTSSRKDNFDIYLPEWLARNNKVIFTILFLLGLVGVVYRVISST